MPNAPQITRAHDTATLRHPHSAKIYLNKCQACGVGYICWLAGALAQDAAFTSRLSLNADLGSLKPLLIFSYFPQLQHTLFIVSISKFRNQFNHPIKIITQTSFFSWLLSILTRNLPTVPSTGARGALSVNQSQKTSFSSSDNIGSINQLMNRCALSGLSIYSMSNEALVTGSFRSLISNTWALPTNSPFTGS